MEIDKKHTDRVGYDQEEAYFNRLNREAIEKLKRRKALEGELARRRQPKNERKPPTPEKPR